ncbi:MAG: SpoIIE family protein phosphatase [Bacteroidales bacterium]|nr:SpoIIE family protein phosphatase [Bacteroidales bacterium]
MTFVRPTPEECYRFMQQFMAANPIVCGIAIEFERNVYSDVESIYGFTPYVTRLSGEFRHMDLGMITDSFEWEWYTKPAQTGKACWVSPFRDSSVDHVIASYTIPVYTSGKLFAVMAVDIDTESFSSKCDEISPYPGASVTMIDDRSRFISHPDSSYLMKRVYDINETEELTIDKDTQDKMELGQPGRAIIRWNDEEMLLYFAPIERTDWMVTIRCPEHEVFGGVKRMKNVTTRIAVLSILVMILSLLLIFRNVQSAVITKARIENELKVAAEIQLDMLPKGYSDSPDCETVDVFGFQKSAKSVGGDLYDYFIRDGKLFFCLGDVSGKGVPAALYMAVILSLFRNITNGCENPDEIVGSINNTMEERNASNMFCTLFVGVLDLATGHMTYCNAGHNAPMVKRAGKERDVRFAKVNVNLAIGVLSRFAYKGEEMQLHPGDMVLLYTDGVTEAEDRNKNLFGDEAALAAFADATRNTSTDSKKCMESIYDALTAHTSGAEQNDDITVLASAFKGRGEI